MPLPKSEPQALPAAKKAIIPAQIDKMVDTMLVKYGVDLKRVRKRKIAVPGNEFVRIERQVPLPPSVAMLLMTADFQAMAKQYGGRAIASENSKDNTVTVHIEEDKTILQSLILRHAASVYEPMSKESKKKTVTRTNTKRASKPIPHHRTH